MASPAQSPQSAPSCPPRAGGNDLRPPCHHDIGARTELRHRLSRRTTGHVTLSRHERRYEERDHLDGPVTDLSLGAGWVASPTIRIDAAVGWGRDKPETERYRNQRRWMRPGATAALP